MKPRIALLPLDDRPVNYDYPGYLARSAGFELLLPPRDWLGNPWRPSRHAQLIQWLRERTDNSDALIVAIDTLAYGGLIPSRTSNEPLEQVLERLSILKAIKATHPNITILGSSVVLRISRQNSSEEEKPYWAFYGNRMFRLSIHEHRIAIGEATAEEISGAQSLRAEIPDEVYWDYRHGRDRNHAVNQTMLSWLSEGIFDYLILPQDDTAEYGWNILEARALQARIRAEGLTDRAITYPGADEIGCLLLASYVCQQANFHPKSLAALLQYPISKCDHLL